MKPVMQTTSGWPDGNCFDACLASLLECDIDTIAHYTEPATGEWGQHWLDFYGEQLARRGYTLLYIDLTRGAKWPWTSSGALCIVGGVSPRAAAQGETWQHAVIGRLRWDANEFGIEWIHDPHPSGDFLHGDPQDLIFLLPRDAP